MSRLPLLRVLTLPILLALALGCALGGKEKKDDEGGLFDKDGDGSPFTADCDDDDPTRSPKLPELCDDLGKDEDCDDAADLADDEFSDVGPWYPDEDGDGFGDEAGVIEACTQPDDAVEVAGDCDDGDEDVRPDATEVCDDDDVDEDCDGLADDADDDVDEDSLSRWYLDEDQDEYGVRDETTDACDAGDGWADNDDDCDDTESRMNPGRSETCDDGLDNDCDGSQGGCGISGDEVLDEDGADAMIYGTYYDDYLPTHLLGCNVDGDGKDDLVIASDNVGFSNGGEIYVFEGSFSGDHPASDADSVVTSSYGYAQLGEGVACFDTDGDGLDDIVGGAPGVYTFVAIWQSPLDSAEDIDAMEVLWQEGEDLGTTLLGGDLDGDGQEDLVIGDSASLWVAAGPIASGNRTLSEAFLELTGVPDSDYDDALVADLDGDGVGDLVYGDPANDTVYVVLGGAAGTLDLVADADRVWAGEADSSAGRALDAGDLDDDGSLDLVVGALGAGDGGEVYLVAGATASGPLAGSPTVEGLSGESLGYGVAAPGDVTGDGVADLLALAPGLGDDGGVYLFAGPVGAGDSRDALASVQGEQGGMSISVLAGVGDTDNDGVNDWVVGADRWDWGGDDNVGGVFLYLGGGL